MLQQPYLNPSAPPGSSITPSSVTYSETMIFLMVFSFFFSSIPGFFGLPNCRFCRPPAPPAFPFLPPAAAGGKEGVRGHLALRQEGGKPSCTTCFSVITGKPNCPFVDTMVFAMCRDVQRCPSWPSNERGRATIAILRVYVRTDQNTSLEK